MDELSRKYRGIYVQQKEIVKERLIAAVVDSLDSLSDVVCGQLQSITESYPHVNARTGTQANQQLINAQNVVQEAGRMYGQQLASRLTEGLNSLNILPTAIAGSVAFNQPTADISISGTQAQVNTSMNQSNDANEDSDDEAMSVKSEINSEDECLSDSDCQSDVDVKEEPDETQTETQINQTDDSTNQTQGFNSLNIVLPSIAIAGSIAVNQPTADISISGTQAQVNTSINQSNDATEDSDDEAMSVKSEINSEDECLSDSDCQSDVDVKEEPEESQNGTQINQTDDTTTVKDEIVSSSECESDTDSDDYESDTMQVKEEDQEDDEIRFVHTSNNQGLVANGASFEESENIAQSDGNVETANSSESNIEHQSDGMLMDDEENVVDESQDEPTITVVNYEEEFEAQFIGNSNDQDFVLDGSLDEGSENVSQQEERGNTVDSHMNDSNEDDNQHSLSQEVPDEQENSTEASTEPDQAGTPIASNAASTLARRPIRVSASKTVNYSEAMENSVIELQQQATLTGTRKRKRSNGRSGKSTAHKRTRVVPAPTVAPEEATESEDEDEAEPESITLRVIVRRLKCRVSGCKKLFPSKVQLDGHLLSKHAIEKYACKVKDCTASYATRTELKAHRDSAHDNLDNDWPCGQCEVTCTTYQSLYTHTWHYHEYGLFACSADRCDFTEKTRIKVKTHQQTHRPAKHHCTFAGCSSSFYIKANLTAHLRTHSKEQPFVCSQCHKAFAQKGTLTTHELTHFGLKPFSCTWPHCDYSARQQSDVIGHVRGVHFGLPRSKTEQAKRGIIDNRDARLFLKKTSTTGN